MSEDQKKQLEQQLWNIANTLRGKMNADEFRDYILGFIFYKYLSEKMRMYANNILKPDGIVFTSIQENTENGKEYIEAIKEEAVEKLGYFLKPTELFSQIAKRGNSDVEGISNFILEDLQKILTNIQLSTMGTESEEDFDNLFEDMDLNSTKLGKSPEARNEIIAKVLSHLDKIDFKLENTEIDVLGDAYEYLIGQFASGAGKKAGEFYTPQEVSKVLAKLVTSGKTKLKSVYDPTCGSGSLLLRVAKEVESVTNFYGQELNRTTYNLARMNMILHDIHYRKFNIKQEDTLEHPQHIDDRFEAIVANPPFSAKWSANPLFTSDDRFSQYGKLAPKSKADFAFVQHMIHHLAENGTMALVLPHGALFRGGAEQHIRKYLVTEKNYLDAVIGLPTNIFVGAATTPTCILVFKKCRENPDNILFIDSSDYFEKNKKLNRLRIEDVSKIASTYEKREVIEKYSNVVSVEKVIENDCRLNISIYVEKFEHKKIYNLKDISSKLLDLKNTSSENDKLLESFGKQLNIPAPIGENLDLLKNYKASVKHELFNKNIRFKRDDNSEYPDWRKIKLGEIAKFKNGKAHEGDIDKNGNFIVVNSKFISTSGETAKYSNLAILPLFEKDIVMVMSDVPKGKALAKCFIIDSNNKYTLNQRICSISSDKLYHIYLYYQLNRNKYYLKFDSGVGQTNLKRQDVLNCPIIYPSLEEQHKIADFLFCIDKKIKLIEQKVHIENS